MLVNLLAYVITTRCHSYLSELLYIVVVSEQAVRASCQSKVSEQGIRARCQSKVSEQGVRASCQSKLSEQGVRASCQSKLSEHDVIASCQSLLYKAFIALVEQVLRTNVLTNNIKIYRSASQTIKVPW